MAVQGWGGRLAGDSGEIGGRGLPPALVWGRDKGLSLRGVWEPWRPGEGGSPVDFGWPSRVSSTGARNRGEPARQRERPGAQGVTGTKAVGKPGLRAPPSRLLCDITPSAYNLVSECPERKGRDCLHQPRQFPGAPRGQCLEAQADVLGTDASLTVFPGPQASSWSVLTPLALPAASLRTPPPSSAPCRPAPRHQDLFTRVWGGTPTGSPSCPHPLQSALKQAAQDLTSSPRPKQRQRHPCTVAYEVPVTSPVPPLISPPPLSWLTRTRLKPSLLPSTSEARGWNDVHRHPRGALSPLPTKPPRPPYATLSLTLSWPAGPLRGSHRLLTAQATPFGALPTVCNSSCCLPGGSAGVWMEGGGRALEVHGHDPGAGTGAWGLI